jgi:diguanylate cyclase (GGDEF)-like protein
MLNVITASNGIEAIKHVRENRNIKLVITSYDLAIENGIELVIALRKAYKKDELPIFGLIDDELTSSIFLKYGINDFIKKPIIKDELIIRVNNILNSHENIKRLKKFANTDYMTQVANRKYFYQVIGKYYKRAKRENIPFAIAMIDIDYFKHINDTYGHNVGDMVIKSVASLIKDNIKGQDMVARFGGEEFCVALKDIDKNFAYSFLDSIREKISSMKFDVGEGVSISFTVSIGVCSEYKNSLEEMVKESDRYLYLAKSRGRNKVCSNLYEKVESLV